MGNDVADEVRMKLLCQISSIKPLHSTRRAKPNPAINKSEKSSSLVKSFPMKLYELLSRVDKEGINAIISWQPHGLCFVIRAPERFVEEVIPRYFKQTKLSSFQRQLNVYDFSRISSGPDRGGYYHKLFLRGRYQLCKSISRRPLKKDHFKLNVGMENNQVQKLEAYGRGLDIS